MSKESDKIRGDLGCVLCELSEGFSEKVSDECWEIINELVDLERQETSLKFARLLSETSEMVKGYEARKTLDEGFKGMGHNILTEDAGIFSSPSKWRKLREIVDETEKFYEKVMK